MKVLLAKPGHPQHYVVSPNLGLGYLATAVRTHGHEPRIFHGGRHRRPLKAFEGMVRSWKPDAVGLQLFSHELSLAADYARAVRTSVPDAHLLLGGPHPSADPRGTIDATRADYVVIGEAEDALSSLLEVLRHGRPSARALEDVPNLAWANGDALHETRRVLPEPLESLGLPSWDLMDPRTYPAAPHGTFARHFPVAPMITSRGCPFSCTFCAARLMSGSRVRARPAEDVVEEVALLVNRFGVREIHFEDDNIAYDPDHVSAICEALLRRDLVVAWSCPNGVRVDRIDASLARLMERAGCYSLAVGIESGSQRILDAMCKGTNLQQLELSMRAITEHTRIALTGFFLIGYPGEESSDLEATVELALRLPLSKALFAFPLPHPGSDLYRIYVETSGSEPPQCRFLYCQSQVPYFKPTDMTLDELRKMHRAAYRRFYLRPRTLLGLLGELRRPGQMRQLVRRLGPLMGSDS